jgi:putative transposase
MGKREERNILSSQKRENHKLFHVTHKEGGSMEDKRQQDIALFRYRLIAPVLNEASVCQAQYFRQMSEREFDVPHLGRKRYEVGTMKSWLRDYRNGGFDALKPKVRSDKGSSRRIDDELGRIIKERVDTFACLTPAAIYRILISEGDIKPDQVGEATVRKYIKDNGLKMATKDAVARKKFEKEHINELWISDCLHGPCLVHERRKRQVFLISIIDDYSRCVVGGRFFFHENSVSLEMVLKEAIGRFGLPRVFYCDNGSMFVSSHLQLACARLGIALVHSKPYDSPSRGKIERFNRTVREVFFPLVDWQNTDLIQLNTSFDRWLDKDYQKSFHHGIQTKPMDRWMDDLACVSIRRVASEELDLAFYISIKRRVKNDSTISVNSILYEVPPAFIGKVIELRSPSDNPKDLTIYENGKPVYKVKRVNPHENANLPAWGIKFNPQGDTK